MNFDDPRECCVIFFSLGHHTHRPLWSFHSPNIHTLILGLYKILSIMQYVLRLLHNCLAFTMAYSDCDTKDNLNEKRATYQYKAHETSASIPVKYVILHLLQNHTSKSHICLHHPKPSPDSSYTCVLEWVHLLNSRCCLPLVRVRTEMQAVDAA